jgi:hypothetical protein
MHTGGSIRKNQLDEVGVMLFKDLKNEGINVKTVQYENVADQLARDQNKAITSVSNELKQKYERMRSAGEINANTEKALIGYKKFNGN